MQKYIIATFLGIVILITFVFSYKVVKPKSFIKNNITSSSSSSSISQTTDNLAQDSNINQNGNPDNFFNFGGGNSGSNFYPISNNIENTNGNLVTNPNLNNINNTQVGLGGEAITPTGSEKIPPTVSITSPSPSATLSSTININANATDASGIYKVEFYIGSKLIGDDATSPYSITYDTKTTTNGFN